MKRTLIMIMMAMVTMILMMGCDGTTHNNPGCTKDTDCRDGRICVDGKCVNPTDGDTDTVEGETDGDMDAVDPVDDENTEDNEEATELEQSDEPCIPGEWENQTCSELQGTCPETDQLCLSAYCMVYDGAYYNAPKENPEWAVGEEAPEGYGPASKPEAPDSSVRRWLKPCTNWGVWECNPEKECCDAIGLWESPGTECTTDEHRDGTCQIDPENSDLMVCEPIPVEWPHPNDFEV